MIKKIHCPTISIKRASFLIPVLFLTIIFNKEVFMQQGNDRTGMFSFSENVGSNMLKGSIEFDVEKNVYRITGSGENIWARKDAFYYASKKVTGDLSMKCSIAWDGKGKHEHRKAGWMVRESLDEDAPYVDAVLHGDGLLSMQYRTTKGGDTFELQAPIKTDALLILERTGDQFTFMLQAGDGTTINVGTVTVKLPDELYAGLAVCSHDSTTVETALFSKVTLDEYGIVKTEERVLESTLEVFDFATGVRRIVRKAKEHFEAPNWYNDGKYFIYNKGGKLYRLATEGGEPVEINTSFATNCNNDHGISPDGKHLVISNWMETGGSKIFTLPISGGEPKLITQNGPSYWHGWSPDGKILAYCAERNGQFDIYTIPVDGGDETQLTDAPGLDDGPEYSPDGKFIYFNSVRTGQMKIWRMKADGSEQTQITPDDNFGDWFAHPSPDNKHLVFVSYDKSVDGHPANKDVVLRTMPVGGGEPKVIATLFGGQGTINVPSWSPDSKQFAFVSYRLVKP